MLAVCMMVSCDVGCLYDGKCGVSCLYDGKCVMLAVCMMVSVWCWLCV